MSNSTVQQQVDFDRLITFAEKGFLSSLIIESTDLAINATTMEGVVTSWNHGAEKIYGYKASEIIGKNISLIIPQDHPDELIQLLIQVSIGMDIPYYKTKRIRKDGEIIDVSLSLSPIKDKKLKVIGFARFSRDITDVVMAQTELAFQNEEKKNRAEELVIANIELAFQNEEKKKRAEELVIANLELAFQNEEKEKRVEELFKANKKLGFQNEEKEKRAAELVIADIELVFQNKEKEKRADELFIANQELVFQNEEKEKRAAELFIANQELVFQNQEKEKRAAELFIANQELAFQNEEKEKRAAELLIANKELVFQNEEKGKRAAELIITNNELAFAKEIEMAKLELEILANHLQKQNSKLLNFSHIASHNLRSPVSNLNSLLNFYKQSEDSEDKEILFSKFETVIHHLTSTLNDLTDALKIQEDLSKESELLIFDEILGKTIEVLAGQILETHTVVTHDFSKALNIECPKSYLESIMLNLLSNAIKYRSPDRTPEIHFQTEDMNDRLILTVCDNGLGIDLEKYSNKLFGLNNTFHKHAESKGVGLFITKTQVEAMGGSISAESEVGKGTKFSVILKKIG